MGCINRAEKYPLPTGFDVQAHRGGRGHWTEESALAFENALKLGVSTLELDVVLTKDGVPAVWHDPVLLAEKCSSRVGEVVHELTWAELREVECAKLLPDFPHAEVAAGNRILHLAEVFEIAQGYDVHFNIETKIEADKPCLSAEPKAFVDAILREVYAANVAERVMVQSFDWRTFALVRGVDKRIPLVALWDETTWFEGDALGPWRGYCAGGARARHQRTVPRLPACRRRAYRTRARTRAVRCAVDGKRRGRYASAHRPRRGWVDY